MYKLLSLHHCLDRCRYRSHEQNLAKAEGGSESQGVKGWLSWVGQEEKGIPGEGHKGSNDREMPKNRHPQGLGIFQGGQCRGRVYRAKGSIWSWKDRLGQIQRPLLTLLRGGSRAVKGWEAEVGAEDWGPPGVRMEEMNVEKFVKRILIIISTNMYWICSVCPAKC